MPNWCENSLTVSGEFQELRKFKQENTYTEDGEVTLSFNLMVTLPQEEEDNWYDWQIENWGTKWDLRNCIIEDDENILSFDFDTAWGPPEKWLENVSVFYPNLEFKLLYAEPGMSFSGKTVVENGILLVQEHGDYGEYHGEIDWTESEDESENESDVQINED